MSEAHSTSSVQSPSNIMFIRSDFYRKGYQRILRIAVLEAIVILALCAGLFFVLKTHQPQDSYFATTEKGRIIEMTALSEPNLTDNALLYWSALVASDAMTYAFNDYHRRFQEVSRNFTHDGWSGYVKALQNSGALGVLVANQQRITAAPADSPVLVSKYLSEGAFKWRVQIPMVVTTEAGATPRPDRAFVEMVITRVPGQDNPNGVGIEQMHIQ